MTARSGIGRAASPAGEAVSRDLRGGSGELLARRRRVAALSLGGGAALGVVALYQFGLVKHLPDPPIRVFDSDRVDAAGEAYSFLHTPDATLGLASYAATAALAGAGGSNRASERPLLPLALALKVAFDAASAAWLTAEQITKHRRLCSYCLAAAVASFATVPHVIPEARRAWSELRRSR